MKNTLSFFTIAFFLFNFSIAFGQFSSGYEINGQTPDAKDIEIADIDGDGLKDIIVSQFTNDNISWFRNIGGDQFGLVQEITPFYDNVLSMASGDIDNDGDIDLFASSSTTGGIVWFENDSTGNFGSAILIAPVQWCHINSADINGDGLIDLISGSESSDIVSWYENLGGGIFAAEQQISTLANGVKEVISADIDGDLDLDLVSVSKNDNKLAWYENLGAGAFGPQQVISTSADGANGVYAADLDNDLDLDLAVSSYDDQKIAWYENLGGTFSAENIITSNASSIEDVTCGDMDNDGNIDVLGVEFNSPYVKLVWFQNTGGGVFSGYTEISDGSSATFAYAEDMDSDGDMDVVNIYSGAWQVVYHENPGSGLFGDDLRLTVWGNPSRGKPIDIDQDGDLDVLITSGNSFWCENLGDGTFGAVKRSLSGDFKGADMADLDNDGDLDLVIANGANSSNDNVIWRENLGNGNYSSDIAISMDVPSSRRIEIADIDGDGLIDIVASGGLDVAWFKNLGNGNFTSANMLGTVSWCLSVDVFDLNSDGNLDVLYVSENDNTVCWNENLGSGNFGPQTTIGNNQMGACGTSAVDIDNDGDLDVFVASRNDDKVAWYENLGGGNFGPENVVTTLLEDAYDVYFADFDIDGDMDLVAAALNESIFWYENISNGTFGPAQAIGNQVIGQEALEGGDFDGDGDIDILSVNYSYNSIRIYENYNISSMQIKGRIFVDENMNGQHDTLETDIPQIGIISTPSVGYTYTYPDGRYFMLFDGLQGNYQIDAQPLQYWGLTTTPTSYSINIGPSFVSLDSLDFGFYPDTIVDDIELSLIGAFPRCNDTVNYWLDLENIGTTFPSGVINLSLDDSLTFVTADILPDSIVGQDIFWHYDTLNHFETVQINALVIMPDFNSIGDDIISTLNVATDSLGTIIYENADTLIQSIACAYDPNDKKAEPSGDSLGYIWPAPESIDYTVRFQNTGTDTAITVIIQDQLDDNLVWNTLHPIASSHPMHVNMSVDGEVDFIFENIMLPDSNVNESASHGFVQFSIDVVPGLPIETELSNTANIYFDLNPAVITNTVTHIFDTLDTGSSNGISILDNTESILIYPNPFGNKLSIHFSNNQSKLYAISLMDINGRTIYEGGYSLEQKTQLDLSDIEPAVYFIHAIDEQGQLLFVNKVIKH